MEQEHKYYPSLSNKFNVDNLPFIKELFGFKSYKFPHIKNSIKPAFCDYINGTTGRSQGPCRYGFKLKTT